MESRDAAAAAFDFEQQIFNALAPNVTHRILPALSLAFSRALTAPISTLASSDEDLHRGPLAWRPLRAFFSSVSVSSRFQVLLHQQNKTNPTTRLLAECFVFEQIRPVCFATFATPHLGVRRPQVHPIDVAFQSVAWWINRTTLDLFLEDDEARPVLHAMTEPHFLDPLRHFLVRCAYANVRNDLQIPYWSAALTDHHPYSPVAANSPTNTSPQLSHSSLQPNPQSQTTPPTVTPSTAPTSTFPSLTAWSVYSSSQRVPRRRRAQSFFDHELEPKKSRLAEMLDRLTSMEWRRFDASFATVFAHEQIINKRAPFAGADVPDHFASVLLEADVKADRAMRNGNGSGWRWRGGGVGSDDEDERDRIEDDEGMVTATLRSVGRDSSESDLDGA